MVQKIKDVLGVGPRTRIADRDMKVGDIALVVLDDGRERLVRISGAYTLGGVWNVTITQPQAGVVSYRLPLHVKLRQIKAVYRKVR